ncbi:MAG: imidazoleglycerol-phosphate dehydratase HisB [Spirochaetales bacterium]|nr:imidazoleglycerol-phosphate dehydratase HisB [Spirochaetales bacterium]
MRESEIKRKTAETDNSLSLCIDGTGKSEISTGIGFLDHMLTLFARHGRFDLCIKCKGDTCVDDHHSTEDIGIALGQALRQALGDKKGICRYGDIILPMDEALILASVDISGRGMLCLSAEFRTEKIGTFDTELVEEFFQAFASNAGITLHIRQLDGRNSHHIAEGMFKATARALRKAVAIDEAACDEIPSTKGVL